MTTLVLGATGKHLVQQLISLGENVRVVVRPTSKVPDDWQRSKNVRIITSAIHEMTVAEMVDHLKGCTAVASCLGHNLSFKGILWCTGKVGFRFRSFSL